MPPTFAAEADLSALVESLTPRPKTVPEFGAQLAVVKNLLIPAGFAQVEPFVGVYLPLTNELENALDQAVFKDPVTTEALTCDFGGWFFDALLWHIEGNESAVPPAWRYLFGQSASRPRAELAAYGVNAHIANDLPQAAHRIGVTAGYKDDFFRVDPILTATAPEIMPGYVSGNRLLQLGATAVSVNVVKRLRSHAWKNLLSLNEASDQIASIHALSVVRSGIEREALQNARCITAAGSLATFATSMLSLLHSRLQS